MPQKTWFTTEQVEMLHTDVEGDGKQVVSRPATEQDKRDFSAQYTDFQNKGAQAQPANQQQPAQAGQQGATAQNQQGAQQPSGTNPPR